VGGGRGKGVFELPVGGAIKQLIKTEAKEKLKGRLLPGEPTPHTTHKKTEI